MSEGMYYKAWFKSLFVWYLHNVGDWLLASGLFVKRPYWRLMLAYANNLDATSVNPPNHRR